ncbi:MAG: fumarylacetoacetate hydrolase family protein [Acidobacteriales bacterium]|nr:fumarylacetoacetate hydrolase family protein [Terriglobales bacterium]
MKLVTYRNTHGSRAGAVCGEWIVDLNRADAALPATIVELLEAGTPALERADGVVQSLERQVSDGQQQTLQERGLLAPLSEATLLAPVPRPPKLLAVWVNYMEHGNEAAITPPTAAPLFFTKFSTAVIGPKQPIVLPKISTKVDYEAELALVIGKRGKNIPAERAYNYVAGYTILNDVSARDFSLKALLGVVGPSDVQKSFDTFAPMGPWLVTADEIPDPHALHIRLSIGHDVLQDSSTGEMIHRIPAIIAYISSIATLEPGDVVTTGTPPGVGFARTPPRWLRPGETVQIEVERIGVLENPVVSE